MQLTGIPLKVVGEDATLLRGPGGADLSYMTNTLYIGPGESRDVLFRAPAFVGPGQTDPALLNAQRGFFLAYVNSFNEWHEGHAFEPMKDAPMLSPEEQASGYHNPERGDYRLGLLEKLLRAQAS